MTWWHSFDSETQKECDVLLREQKRLELEYPRYRNCQACEDDLNSENLETRERYRAFASLVWNNYETMVARYARRFGTSQFAPALRNFAVVHYRFFWRFETDYGDELRSLVNMILAQEGIPRPTAGQ